jgi:eukaryotic-like serine/threonine-protein kinase
MLDPQSAAPDEAPDTGPRSRNRIGEVIGDKYDVVRFLGEGGMGAVYEVKHRVIGRHFAIKFLHADVARSPSMVTRFRREAEAAGRLLSENVVAVVDFGAENDGTPFLVMEYLEGENLGRLLARVGALPVGRAVSIVLRVCRGLQAAHAHGIIHRDLKPENVFVLKGEDGADLVKILDFGIAKLTTDNPLGMTHSGMTLGTPHYMSPEQARGDKDIDERTDVFAVGVILYELLTATKPHPGLNATAVLFHLLKQAPVRIEILRPGLPMELANAIHRAFAFDAADRFRSVADFSTAIASYATREDIDARASLVPVAQGEANAALSTTELQLAQSAHPRAVPTTGSTESAAGGRAGVRRRAGRRLAVSLALGAFTFALAATAIWARLYPARVPEEASAPTASGKSEPRSLERLERAEDPPAHTPSGEAGVASNPTAPPSIDPGARPVEKPPPVRVPSAPRRAPSAGPVRSLPKEDLYAP